MTFNALPLGLLVGGVRTASGNGFSPIVTTRFFRRLILTLLRRGGDTSGVSPFSAFPPRFFSLFSSLAATEAFSFVFFFFFFDTLDDGVSPSALAPASGAVSASNGDPNASALCLFFFFPSFVFSFVFSLVFSLVFAFVFLAAGGVTSAVPFSARLLPFFSFFSGCLFPACSSSDDAWYRYLRLVALVSLHDPA